MPKIERYLIKAFADLKPKPVYQVNVPVGSSFTNKVKVLHDGIYAIFEVPTIVSVEDTLIKHEFVIVNPKDLIPENASLVDILDVIFEADPGEGSAAEPTQGVMLIPIYKLW